MKCLPLDSEIVKQEQISVPSVVLYWLNRNGEFQSFNDQPSFLNKNQMYWHKNGTRTRGYDKPAYIDRKIGLKEWHVNGQIIKRETSDGTITLY